MSHEAVDVVILGGLPPRFAGGIIPAINAHSASVMSLG